MNATHVERLCEDFNLGSNPVAEENHEGVLNRNYVLTTDQGRYFVKSIRIKRKTSLPYIAEVEAFMYEKGIPAICMLRSVRGEKYVEYGADTYTVYPFLESVRTHEYGERDFEAMGSMLGSIHRAGSTDVPVSLASKLFAEKPMDTVLATLVEHQTRISKQSDPDEVDTLFLAYIELKLRMHAKAKEVLPLPMDTLVHGDYHARNLLIDSNRHIIGICDWEQASMHARAYELARSLLYICFNGEGCEKSHLYDTNQGIESAREFIKGYASIYPISNEEIVAGIQLRWKKLVCSVWIEEQYYAHNDVRSNTFIPHEMRLIEDFAHHSLIQKLLAN